MRFVGTIFSWIARERIFVLILIEILILIVPIHLLEVLDDLIQVSPSDLVEVSILASFSLGVDERVLTFLVRPYWHECINETLGMSVSTRLLAYVLVVVGLLNLIVVASLDQALGLIGFGHSSSLCSEPYYPHRLCTMPSSSRVTPGSWRLFLAALTLLRHSLVL